MLIENDPLNGQNSHLFSPEDRERTAQMLSVSILRHSKKKTSSSLSYIINQSNYIHNRLVSRGKIKNDFENIKIIFFFRNSTSRISKAGHLFTRDMTTRPDVTVDCFNKTVHMLMTF